MFRKIKDRVRDARTRVKLCARLVGLRLDTELVEDGASEDIESTSVFTPFKGFTFYVGLIKVTGTAFDVIQVTEFLSDKPIETDYAVKGDVMGQEARVTATTKAKKTRLIMKKAVEFAWNGGEIGEILYRAHTLKESTLDPQMLDNWDTEIRPDAKRCYMRIHTYCSRGELPSVKAVEYYNTIAKHARTVI